MLAFSKHRVALPDEVGNTNLVKKYDLTPRCSM